MKRFLEWLVRLLVKGDDVRENRPVVDGATDEPDTGLTADEQEGEKVWASAEFYNFPEVVRSWPVKDRLIITDGVKPSLFHFDFGRRELWPNQGGTVAHIICLLNRDGRWKACACDALKPGSDRVQKERSCLVVGRGDKREFEPGEKEVAWVLAAGFCRNNRGLKPAQRTALVKMVVWPDRKPKD